MTSGHQQLFTGKETEDPSCTVTRVERQGALVSVAPAAVLAPELATGICNDIRTSATALLARKLRILPTLRALVSVAPAAVLAPELATGICNDIRTSATLLARKLRTLSALVTRVDQQGALVSVAPAAVLAPELATGICNDIRTSATLLARKLRTLPALVTRVERQRALVSVAPAAVLAPELATGICNDIRTSATLLARKLRTLPALVTRVERQGALDISNSLLARKQDPSCTVTSGATGSACECSSCRSARTNLPPTAMTSGHQQLFTGKETEDPSHTRNESGMTESLSVAPAAVLAPELATGICNDIRTSATLLARKLRTLLHCNESGSGSASPAAVLAPELATGICNDIRTSATLLARKLRTLPALVTRVERQGALVSVAPAAVLAPELATCICNDIRTSATLYWQGN
ncbi:hypothetical protein J6590_014760 [Homalodisca vitripennis]|nr:hypothetical protein J6590_014760 [Homalodisca vitripennis]